MKGVAYASDASTDLQLDYELVLKFGLVFWESSELIAMHKTEAGEKQRR
jgi:hypothetical protein